MRVYHSAYHDVTYQPRRLAKRIARVSRNLLKLRKKLWFDAIVFRGSSGASIAYAVSAITRIPIVYVRKNGEHNHGSKIEGTDNNVRKYIILDDFISGGNTVRTIAKAMRQHAGGLWYLDQPKCVGIALFNDDDERTEWKVQGEFVPILKV